VGRRYGHHVLRILCKLSMEPTPASAAPRIRLGAAAASCSSLPSSFPVWPRWRRPSPARMEWPSGRFSSLTPLAGRFGSEFCSPSAAFSATCSSAIPACSLGRPLLRRAARPGHFGVLFGPSLPAEDVLAKLAASRLEPEELKAKLDAGEKVFIVDLRHPLELLPDPFTLPGAVHFSPEALAERHNEIPRDRDIVLYCTCPSEATAAKTAMILHKLESSACGPCVAASTNGSASVTAGSDPAARAAAIQRAK